MTQDPTVAKTSNRESVYISRKVIFIMKSPFPDPHFITGLSTSKVHRHIVVSNEADFLKMFLRPNVYKHLQKHFEKTDKWKGLDDAYVNFTHFARVEAGTDSFPFTKDGFFAGWQRHVAYFLDKNFHSFDIAIPMAFRFRNACSDTIDPDCMSFMFISVNNCSGNDMINEPFLPRECVEGVYGPTNITSVEKNVNVRLTLNKFKFINPGGIPGSGDIPEDVWIQTTNDKPFIAFAMSMGDTARETNLFVGEKKRNAFHMQAIMYRQLITHIELLLH